PGDLDGRHPEVVELDPVVAGGEVAQGGVAALAHLGEDGAHLLHGRFCPGRGPRQPATEVGGAGPAQVETAEHVRQRYRRPLEPPAGKATGPSCPPWPPPSTS